MDSVRRVGRALDRAQGHDQEHLPASPAGFVASADAVELAIVRSALAVLIQRAGGSIEYTESEFQGVRDWHGAYRIVGDIDRSGDGEPRIQLRITPRSGTALEA